MRDDCEHICIRGVVDLEGVLDVVWNNRQAVGISTLAPSTEQPVQLKCIHVLVRCNTARKIACSPRLVDEGRGVVRRIVAPLVRESRRAGAGIPINFASNVAFAVPVGGPDRGSDACESGTFNEPARRGGYLRYGATR